MIPPQDKPHNRHADCSTNAPLILVVDDDIVLCTLLHTMLRGKGYRVTTATSGQSALEQVRQTPPDLITLDYMMPDLSGLQVLERLAQNLVTAAIPVILVTAVEKHMLQLDSLRQQMYLDYVRKPFPRKLLLDRISQSLTIAHAAEP